MKSSIDQMMTCSLSGSKFGGGAPIFSLRLTQRIRDCSLLTLFREILGH